MFPKKYKRKISSMNDMDDVEVQVVLESDDSSGINNF